jgi:hypothetical protein
VPLWQQLVRAPNSVHLVQQGLLLLLLLLPPPPLLQQQQEPGVCHRTWPQQLLPQAAA